MGFFDDIDVVPRERATLKTLPPTPDRGWRPPTYFPNLSDAVHIGFDWEMKEFDFDHGPGWARGKSHIVGSAINALFRDGSEYTNYFPMRHEVDTQYNLDPLQCEAFFRDVLALHCSKSGANLQYDVGSASDVDIRVNGELHDPQVAEALLTEGGNVALDDISRKYLGFGKDTDAGYAWSAQAYGGEPTASQRKNIYRWSPLLAGPYAMVDARAPRRVLEKQWRQMRIEGLLDLYRMECDFTPLLIAMRRAGVRVDLDHAERMKARATEVVNRQYRALYEMTGVHFADDEISDSVRSGPALARAFTAVGVKYPTTESGNPSFRKEWLKNCDHPMSDLILEIRENLTLRDTFLQSYILEGNINGRIHCQFHPLKGEEKGTRSGRFSSSTPNLQNIPTRTLLGKEIREAFLPDVGHFCWEKDDYSQIEYRFLAHFAVDNLGTPKNPIYGEGASSRQLRANYNANPKTDYHDNVYDRTCPYLQWDVNDKALRKLKRPGIKNTNFGLVYAMGMAKLARQLGLTPSQAKAFFDGYHEANPYVKATMNWASEEAQQLGYITTILGRRSRFDLWEPAFTDYGEERKPALSYDVAIRVYGSKIKRAHTHKAINRRLQGSAADLLKVAMMKCWKSGVFHVTGVPRLTVHDELDFSVIDDSPQQREAHAEKKHIMETALMLRVPIITATERGPNWGKVE